MRAPPRQWGRLKFKIDLFKLIYILLNISQFFYFIKVIKSNLDFVCRQNLRARYGSQEN